MGKNEISGGKFHQGKKQSISQKIPRKFWENSWKSQGKLMENFKKIPGKFTEKFPENSWGISRNLKKKKKT